MVLNLLFQATSPQAAPERSFLFIVISFAAIFYFLLFRPMQQQKKKQQKMLRDLQNGQVVVTSGGIVGTIVTIADDDTLVLRVKPDNVKLQVARSAVSNLVPDKGDAKK